jgi:hypothetical protein
MNYYEPGNFIGQGNGTGEGMALRVRDAHGDGGAGSGEGEGFSARIPGGGRILICPLRDAPADPFEQAIMSALLRMER